MLSEQLSIVVSSWLYRSCCRSSFFTVALDEPVRLSNACSLRRLRSAAQLNVGNRPASSGGDGTIRRFRALPVKADHFRNGSWLCKNAFAEVGEKPAPAQSQPTIVAISGLAPPMFMTRVRLARTDCESPLCAKRSELQAGARIRPGRSLSNADDEATTANDPRAGRMGAKCPSGDRRYPRV